jgi:hypothetical protein
MFGEIGELEIGQAALARAQEFAGAHRAWYPAV